MTTVATAVAFSRCSSNNEPVAQTGVRLDVTCELEAFSNLCSLISGDTRGNHA